MHPQSRQRKQSMILGFTWLDKHNPEIDFRARSVKMTRAAVSAVKPTARRNGTQGGTERKAERNARREDTERINTCRTGPFPAFVEDADEAEPTPEQFPDPEADFPDEPLEEGNRIWATGLFPQAEHIRATATVSQWLAEGFRQNSKPSEYIPPHLRDFHSVFSKDSFDELPGTSYETSDKELSNLKKNPSPEPHRNYGSHPPTPSDPQSGRNATASSTTAVASTSRTPPTSAAG